MFLNQQNIFHYLISNEALLTSTIGIDTEGIAKGTIKVFSFDSSLNNVFKIDTGDHVLLLKQSYLINEERKTAFVNERTILRKLPMVQRALRGHIPEQVNFVDGLKLIGIQKFITDSQSLERIINSKPLPDSLHSIYESLGRVLQIIHSVSPEDHRLRVLVPNKSFPFDSDALNRQNLTEQGRFWRILKGLQDDGFVKFLRKEKENWETGCYKQLIHRDLFPTNVLVAAHNKVMIIDWEMCGVGNGLWDVATVLLKSDSMPVNLDYVNSFLQGYFNNTPPPAEDVKKIKKYQILIRLANLARNDVQEVSLTDQIKEILGDFNSI